jgi:phosphoesterase RecJ-like protein
MIEEDFNQVKNLIDRSQRILLISHRKPDGDTVGANLALKIVLEQLGKESVSACVDDIPKILRFLPKSNSFVADFNPEDFDLIFFIDCGASYLCGFDKKYPQILDKNFKPTVNIDHHPSNNLFGQINIVDPSASSTTEIVFKFLKKINIPINYQIATCLLAGIFTDTASYHNQNTTSDTFKISAELLRSGARLNKIVNNVSAPKPVDILKLWGKIISRLQVNKKYKIVFVFISQKDLEEFGASYDDIEGVANFLNTIPEVKATLVLTEQEEQIKGSLRTRDENVDVSELASFLGGGGHKKAAGFTIDGKLVLEEKRWRIK